MRWLILCVPLLLCSCAVLDWVTGADKPVAEGQDPKSLEGSPIEKFTNAASNSGPIGAALAVLVTAGGGYYVARRRKQATT
jgi:hypothetical protein